MNERPRDVAWDDDFWVDSPMSGSAHAVSEQRPDAPPIILVPDGFGDYREHEVVKQPRRKMGF